MKQVALIFAAAFLTLGGSAQAASSCPPGFAMLQDSDTCVRIGGRVRAETILRSSGNRKTDHVTSQASGRVQMDVRKQTEYGPLRAFIRVQGIRR
jgi:hypothetical protein